MKNGKYVNGRGSRFYYVDDKLHREDGPAKTEWVGFEPINYWYINGNLHRTDGPAIEAKGNAEWFIHGQRHREDGPAYMRDGTPYQWHLNDEKLTEQEFNARTLNKELKSNIDNKKKVKI